ncbi:hypothetical protein QJS04_geneDACA022866 [Acorus gramineus]|uniref:Uncharacterized protein n=1 Tax=Acorus gramineus TaxID=55184 RepID=A0AAV9AVR1_ACOGR|nr:hypothetical protein QJS04_geneDACA022866 [Acorus gramineus]
MGMQQSRETTPEDVTYFASSSSPFSFQRQSSDFRQRSRKLSVTTSNKDENISSNDVPFIPLSIEKEGNAVAAQCGF